MYCPCGQFVSMSVESLNLGDSKLRTMLYDQYSHCLSLQTCPRKGLKVMVPLEPVGLECCNTTLVKWLCQVWCLVVAKQDYILRHCVSDYCWIAVGRLAVLD